MATTEEAVEQREHYYGHNRGVVVTQPKPCLFVERPMTPAELAARAPAAKIADDIYRLANYAGVCYIEIWELIAKAAQAAVNAEQAAEWQPIETAPKGIKIFVAYRNAAGKWRRVMASYYGQAELESIDPESEDGYAPAGWYEECETQDDIRRTDEDPELWMSLPALPSVVDKNRG